jgi:hypothetical protein
MIYKPKTALKSKRGYFGIVTSSGPTGPWMRRLSFPVQTNSKPAVNWKQTFLATKQNYRSLAPGGTGYIVVNGYDAQQAWTIQNASYFGILEAGLIQGNIMGMARLISCATSDAYYTMVQANRASLGLDPLPTPEIVTSYLAKANSSDTFTLDGWTVVMLGPNTIDTGDPAFSISVSFDRAPLLASPTNLQASGPDLNVQASEISHLFETILAYGPTGYTATSTPTDITFNIANLGGTNGLVGSFVNSVNYAPAGYNVTNAVITASTPTTVTVASTANPGAMTTEGVASIQAVVADWYTAIINVAPTAATGTGTITLSFSFDDANGTQTCTLPITATTGNPQVAQTCPSFDLPNQLSCHTICDLSYNVIGFQLSYSATGMTNFPMKRNGIEVPGLWEIWASDQYTSSYKPPDASQWQPILFSGPYQPQPADLLAAWEAAYGPLGTSGNIKFQMAYIDPFTGSSGPSLSCTAGWATGTLKGVQRNSWMGPVFNWSSAPIDIGVVAPGSGTMTFAIYGYNGYGGSIDMSVEHVKHGQTYGGMWETALPDGTTFSFAPNPVIIVPGSTTPVTCVLTATSVSGAEAFWAQIKVKAADAISDITKKVVLNVTGTTTPQPDQTGLFITPSTSSPTIPSPGSDLILYTLSNTTPDDLGVILLASSDNVGVTVEFGDFASGAATATSTEITFNYANSEGSNGLLGQTLSSAGYSPDGYNVTDATVIASDPYTVTVATAVNPGTMTVQGQVGLVGVDWTVPGGSIATPGTVTATLSITAAGSIITYGTHIQVEAQAGTLTTYAAVYLA